MVCVSTHLALKLGLVDAHGYWPVYGRSHAIRRRLVFRRNTPHMIRVQRVSCSTELRVQVQPRGRGTPLRRWWYIRQRSQSRYRRQGLCRLSLCPRRRVHFKFGGDLKRRRHPTSLCLLEFRSSWRAGGSEDTITMIVSLSTGPCAALNTAVAAIIHTVQAPRRSPSPSVMASGAIRYVMEQCDGGILLAGEVRSCDQCPNHACRLDPSMPCLLAQRSRTPRSTRSPGPGAGAGSSSPPPRALAMRSSALSTTLCSTQRRSAIATPSRHATAFACRVGAPPRASLSFEKMSPVNAHARDSATFCKTRLNSSSPTQRSVSARATRTG